MKLFLIEHHSIRKHIISQLQSYENNIINNDSYHEYSDHKHLINFAANVPNVNLRFQTFSKAVTDASTCPKCGSNTHGGRCVSCHYSNEASLTSLEAREFTSAG